MNDTTNLIICGICGEPVSFKSDTVADERGRSVRERCYVGKLLGANPAPGNPNVGGKQNAGGGA
jgi:hypothetical protein